MDPIDPNTSPQALASQNTLMRALMERILPQNRLAMVGQGMAANAGAAINGRAYQQHVQEATALGQQPMTPEQFAVMQRGQ